MQKRLGQILVDAEVIDAAKLKEALTECARSGQRLGEVLVEHGVRKPLILKGLAQQFGANIADVAAAAIPDTVLRLVPAPFARAKQALPIFFDTETNTLEVALADPANQDVLDELRFRTGYAVRPLVALPTDLEEALARFYPKEGRAPTQVRLAVVKPAPDEPQSLQAEVDYLREQVRVITDAHHALVKALKSSGVLDSGLI